MRKSMKSAIFVLMLILQSWTVLGSATMENSNRVDTVQVSLDTIPPRVINVDGKRYIVYSQEEDIDILATKKENEYLKEELRYMDSLIAANDRVVNTLERLRVVDSLSLINREQLLGFKDEKIEKLERDSKKLKRKNTFLSILLGIVTLGTVYLITKQL